MDILSKIIQQKLIEIEEHKREVPQEKLADLAKGAPECSGFFREIKSQARSEFALIAEIKFGSPSKGLIRNDLDPTEIAHSYAKNQATCLSVLTDKKFFHSAMPNLPLVKDALTKLGYRTPLLRKDFIVDDYQVVQSRTMGADAILLIVSCLERSKIEAFGSYALELGMDVLIEVHSEPESEIALRALEQIAPPTQRVGLGVNNRNLSTFETNLETSKKLISKLRTESIIQTHQISLVAESGINTRSDLEELKEIGADAFLVGTTLMQHGDPGENLRKLING